MQLWIKGFNTGALWYVDTLWSAREVPLFKHILKSERTDY